jgi:UDP-2,3-diacylglucosamine pyrophosphatase LpxH
MESKDSPRGMSNVRLFSRHKLHLLMNEQKPIKIHLLSDIHVGNESIYPAKKQLIESLIKKLSDEKDSDNIVVLAGDLTDSGFGQAQCLCFWCCLCLNSCCNSAAKDETQMFIDQVYEPLVKVNPQMLICHGNHDESTDNMSYPVLDFIKKTYPHVTNNGCYHKIFNDVCFIILGKYPDKEAIEYFNNLHVELKGKYSYVVIFHYQANPILEVMDMNHYDFWSTYEKEQFKICCNDDTKHIICILVGHVHQTTMDSLVTANKNIPVCFGSSIYSYALIEIDNGKISLFKNVN